MKRFKLKFIRIFIALTALHLCTNLHASEILRYGVQGTPIVFTPFDLKLFCANFYTIEVDQSKLHHLKLPEQIFKESKLLRYQNEGIDDLWQTPEQTAKSGMGDCEDMAIWIYAELRKHGHDSSRFVIGRYERGKNELHAWATLPDREGHLYIFDPVVQPRIMRRDELDPKLYIPLYSYDNHFSYRHFKPQPSKPFTPRDLGRSTEIVKENELQLPISPLFDQIIKSLSSIIDLLEFFST